MLSCSALYADYNCFKGKSNPIFYVLLYQGGCGHIIIWGARHTLWREGNPTRFFLR